MLCAAVAATAIALTAQTPKQQAWTVLQAGAAEKGADNRAAAIRALGIVRADPQVEEMALTALKDSDAGVRVAAATALGRMNARSAIPELKKALRDKEPGVILAAASSLKLMHDDKAYDVYYAVLTGELKSGAGLLAEQKKMLNDPKKMAEFGFEQGIGFIPFAGMGYSVFKVLSKDDKSPVLAAAATALTYDPDPKSGTALVAAASNSSWIVRAAALEAIGRRGEESLVPAILDALNDSKAEVKYTAAAAVYRLSTPAKGK